MGMNEIAGYEVNLRAAHGQEGDSWTKELSS